MDRTARRLNETAAMLLIGDAVLGMLYPRAHCRLWQAGPEWWRDTVEWFATHPTATRTAAAAELAVGLWCAGQQEELAPQ